MLSEHLSNCQLPEFLEAVHQKTFQFQGFELKACLAPGPQMPANLFFTDWFALKVMLAWFPPSHELACPFCFLTKTQWKQPRWWSQGRPWPPVVPGAPANPMLPILQLIPQSCVVCPICCPHICQVYDPLHCLALVVTHGVLHAVALWVKEHTPPFYQVLPGIPVFVCDTKKRVRIVCKNAV
jgi:hypothetical protein